MSYYREIILLSFLLICFYTDLRYHKIFNKVLVSFLLLGEIYNFLLLDINGWVDCIIGGIIPLLIFIPFFIFRMLGAGDIKLFSVIGLFMGKDFIINNIIYSFLCSALIAIIVIIRKKGLFKRFEYFIFYMINFMVSKRIIEYDKSSGTFPLAVGIFLGTAVQLVIKYNFIG